MIYRPGLNPKIAVVVLLAMARLEILGRRRLAACKLGGKEPMLANHLAWLKLTGGKKP